MPKHVQARAALDEQEVRQVRKRALSHHALPDWKVHAPMVAASWKGQTPNEIASALHCHPHTVRVHLARFNAEGISGLGMRPGSGRKRRLTEQDRGRILAQGTRPPPGRLERQGEGLAARDEEGAAQWSLDALEAAAHAAGRGQTQSDPPHLSAALRVRWRGTHRWGKSDDPAFAPKEPPSSPIPPNRPRDRRRCAPTNWGQ